MYLFPFSVIYIEVETTIEEEIDDRVNVEIKDESKDGTYRYFVEWFTIYI